MSVPLVSVVMTVYNCEKYIEESLESIFSQTFKDFEIILYDDASIDETWQVALELLKNSNCVYRMRPGKKNVGCAEGRNRAISRARGKYLAIQDSDDVSFKDRLEKEVKFLEENNDIFCVGAWADKIEENGDFIETMDYPPADNEKIYREMRKYVNPIIDPSSMFRKDVFNKLGGYDGKWRLVPDFNLWVRAMEDGYKFANIQEVLVYYRKHFSSVTTKYHDEAVREHFVMCRDHLPPRNR